MLSDPITRRALLEVLILAPALGPLGVWVLLHRQAYAAESMSHGLLPGLVIAALAGAPLILGAAGGALVAAAAIALVARDERIGTDLGVAVAVSTLFGLGALLALSPEAPPRLEELLFGDLLGLDSADLLAAGALALAVAAALAWSPPPARRSPPSTATPRLRSARARRAGRPRCSCCSPPAPWPPRPGWGACCWWRCSSRRRPRRSASRAA